MSEMPNQVWAGIEGSAREQPAANLIRYKNTARKLAVSGGAFPEAAHRRPLYGGPHHGTTNHRYIFFIAFNNIIAHIRLLFDPHSFIAPIFPFQSIEQAILHAPFIISLYSSILRNY